MAYELVETIEVGSGGAASIEFTSIPQDGVDLVLKINGRGDGSGVGRNAVIDFNNTNAGFSRIRLAGNGSSASSNSTSNTIGFLTKIPAAATTSSTFGNLSILISNYTSSENKSFSVDSVGENNATEADQEITANLWANTNAITSVKLNLNDNWSQYSTASLYKIS